MNFGLMRAAGVARCRVSAFPAVTFTNVLAKASLLSRIWDAKELQR